MQRDIESPPNRNTLWADLFVDELARSGLRSACISPGSRSTPLTISFFRHEHIRVYPIVDERSAGFFALGIALGSGLPVAVVCTSGTAVANLHPAIVEADQSDIPLLILTADRPHELRNSGANQTIDQLKLFGDHVRWFVDVAPPEADPAAPTLRSIRTLACRAYASSNGGRPGPVHLNFPFRKPLEPTPVPDDIPSSLLAAEPLLLRGRPGNAPFTRLNRGRVYPSDDQIDQLTALIQDANRGLIICGPRRSIPERQEFLGRLATVSGYPLLADALSGLRFGAIIAENPGTVLGGYETFLRSEIRDRLQTPELVLQFGAAPTSKALSLYLGEHIGVRRIAIQEHGRWTDPSHGISDLLWADPEIVCRMVADRLESSAFRRADTAWITQWQALESQTWRAIAAVRQTGLSEASILPVVVDSLPSGSLLFVASSLPVRHLDEFVRPDRKPIRAYANRGASGIDGTISSAAGVSVGADLPLVLVIGDLAFYHDMNGLMTIKRFAQYATIVLINNNGGGIFHRLPISAYDPPFQDLFITPHGLNFEPMAQMFALQYHRPQTLEDFQQTFRESLDRTGGNLIEVRTDAAEHERVRRTISQAMIDNPP